MTFPADVASACLFGIFTHNLDISETSGLRKEIYTVTVYMYVCVHVSACYAARIL